VKAAGEHVARVATGHTTQTRSDSDSLATQQPPVREATSVYPQNTPLPARAPPPHEKTCQHPRKSRRPWLLEARRVQVSFMAEDWQAAGSVKSSSIGYSKHVAEVCAGFSRAEPIKRYCKTRYST
jgi:hypothetical protein